MTLTLYSKPGCHLCERLREQLEDLKAEFVFNIEEIDIETDAVLYARYRYAIPVLLADGNEIARGKIGERELIATLARCS